jgi:hypothetical protein
MKIKKEYIILALVIVALSIYLVMRTSDRTQYELPDIPRLEAKEISKLQITRDKAVIVITKKDEKWYMGPEAYPADGSQIEKMLSAIENLTLTALVSESKNYNLYDLDAGKKINVKAWQADKLERDVDLGKTAPSFRHTFVKLAGDERVYHARGNFRNNFDHEADALRDKLVLTLNTAEIKQIQMTKEQQSLTLNKRQAPVEVKAEADAKQGETTQEADQPLWQSADGRPVDEAVVEQILNTVANLRCEKYINDRRKDEFTSPLYTLQMQGAQAYSLSIFAKTDEKDTNYPAVSSGSDYAFLLTDSQVERLMKDPIITPAEPEADEAKSETEDTKSD